MPPCSGSWPPSLKASPSPASGQPCLARWSSASRAGSCPGSLARVGGVSSLRIVSTFDQHVSEGQRWEAAWQGRAVQRSLHGPQREHCIDSSDSDAIAPVTHVVHVVEAEDVGGEGSQASEDAGVAADPTVVLAEADIADIVQPVLDPPMAAD